MPDPIKDDLNTVITAAVNARVEAAVAEALAGGGLITEYVAASLSRDIEVKEPGYSGRYRKTTFLRETIEAAIKAATERAVRKVIDEEQDAIEAQVRETLHRDTAAIAAQLVGSVKDAAERAYGVSVTLDYPGRG